MEEVPQVLENLTEEEAYLFAILSDPSGLDQAEFLWYDPACDDNYAEQNGERTKIRPAPSGCFRAWAYQWPWWRESSPLQIDQCVAGGQLVLTYAGWKTIEKVEVGELVLTHRNRWRHVTAVWDRGEHDVVRIEGQGHLGLVVTADHPILARRSRRGTAARDGHRRKVLEDTEWLTPAEWEWGNGKGRLAANWAMSPTEIDRTSMPEPMKAAAVAGRQNLVSDCLGPEWLWLYGHFIAQGSTFVPKPPGLTYRSTWSVNLAKVEQVTRMLDKVGLNYNVDERPSVACIQVTSRPVTEWLRTHAGHLAHNKFIANWVYGLDPERRQAVFDGMTYGDGHLRPRGRIEYSTSSRALLAGVKILGASLGYSCAPNLAREAGECTIEGRTVARRQAYSIGFETLAGQAKPRCTVESGMMWAPVTGVVPAGSARVYDLEVEEDHSFNVEGIPVHNCARSVGKSLSIKVRGCSFPFLFPGQEMVITAPELVHLEPIVTLIESQLYASRTLREMMPRGKSAVTHRPFQCNFLNGSRIIGRIPQRDGKGVKGIHPIRLEMDEAQDFPHAGWVELRETLKRGFHGATWRAHGVTRGVRDDFYESTQESPDNPWRVHRYAAMWRPNWSDQEREEALQKYGSREDPDYRRNILGLHGDKTNPIFVLTQLMKNVDNDPLSDYNSTEYFRAMLKVEQLELFGQTIDEVLDFPMGHLAYAGDSPQERAMKPKAIYWVGMDIGFTIDPSEILVFVEYRPKPRDPHTVLRLLSRISMARMPHREQLWAMLHTIDFYRPRAFSMDKTGLGLPLFQELQEHVQAFNEKDWNRVPDWMRRYDLDLAVNTVKGYNFSEKLIVDVDQSVEVSRFDDPFVKAGLRRNAKEFATDVLRELVDGQRLWLPWDDDLLKQFQGGTWTSARSMDAYGRRIFSKGNDHVLDASRMAALGWAQHGIEELQRNQPVQPVLDAVLML